MGAYHRLVVFWGMRARCSLRCCRPGLVGFFCVPEQGQKTIWRPGGCVPFPLLRSRNKTPSVVSVLAMPTFGAEQAGIKIDRVINITLPEWITVKKISARRSCPECRRSFNIADVNKGTWEWG